ncbi:MAG: hypothetical protein RIE32_06995 [Phycisphaerales bacterium]
MRSFRAIRTLLVFVLLGAVATVLTSWAIHAVQFWRLRSAASAPYPVPPAFPWPHDPEVAEAWGGINTNPAPGEARIRPDARSRAQDFLDEDWMAQHGPTSPIDGDRLWRRHRSPSLPPLPPYPFPYAFFEVRPRGGGWGVLTSVVYFMEETVNGKRMMTGETMNVSRAGWPAPSMQHEAHWVQLIDRGSRPWLFDHYDSVHVTASPPRASLASGLELWRGSPHNPGWGLVPIEFGPADRFALPLLPIWPGFAINTGFYALLLFIAWRLPGVLRRAVRRRRGRCAACGYDRGGLDPGAACPECGEGAAMGNGQEAMGRRGRPTRRA